VVVEIRVGTCHSWAPEHDRSTKSYREPIRDNHDPAGLRTPDVSPSRRLATNPAEFRCEPYGWGSRPGYGGRGVVITRMVPV